MQTVSLKTLLRPAFESVRTYWPAIVVIQAVALGVVVSYYQLEGASGFFARVAGLKEDGGVLFVALTTVISGGLVPELLKRCFRPARVNAPGASELANQFFMWACLGILIDQFYRMQGSIFGEGTDIATLMTKMAVDQLLFTPFISLPFVVSCFMLHESGYRPRVWLERFSVKLMAYRVLPIYFICLSFWPVMLLVIYSMPQALQFTLYLFANSAYSILMIFAARRNYQGRQGLNR